MRLREALILFAQLNKMGQRHLECFAHPIQRIESGAIITVEDTIKMSAGNTGITGELCNWIIPVLQQMV